MINESLAHIDEVVQGVNETSQHDLDHIQQCKQGQAKNAHISSTPIENLFKASSERETLADEMAAEAEEKTKSLEDKAIDELNQKHAVVHVDQFYILTEKSNPNVGGKDFSLESKQSFKNKYENKTIECKDGQIRTKADIWLKSPKRREYEGIVFDPRNSPSLESYYNLWKGFAKTAIRGNCAKYWQHVQENICAGNDEAYAYLRKWIASVFKYPDEVHTSIVLCGGQGVGKNSLVEPLGVLLGPHYVLLSNLSELVSNFNLHLKNAVLIHANEALWGGHKKELGTLKAMITEKTCLIEGKGKDRLMVRNFKHVILSSNESWPVHLDPDDRRFYVLKVSEGHKEDHVYFTAIQEQLDSGGYEALLYDLLNEDTSNFNPRKLPDSPESFNIKIRSADSVHEYIYEALKEGCFDLGNASPNAVWNDLTTDSVFIDYCAWCIRNGQKGVTKNIFSKKLMHTVPSIKPKRGNDSKRTRMYSLPELSIARSDFQKAFKSGASIWDD